MNDKLNNNVTIIPPFKKFCMTIGELPSSYTETMTYYEMLLWFTNYIGNTLIPAINNNGEAVTELQEKYVELKNYVDTYFDNLDVQEEINNKLDDMAEQGELAEIIAQYLEVASVLGFDTKSDLKGAENLVAGSICKTLGDDNYETGDGHFYRIRELEESDDPDDDELVALTNYPALVAEKIPDYYINDLNSEINTINNTTIPGIQSDISDIEDEIADITAGDRVLFIGDSYCEGYAPGGNVPVGQRFWETFSTKMGYTDVQAIYLGGIGFYQEASSYNALTYLQSQSANITGHDTITKIFVVMGWNDSYQDVTQANIEAAIASFVNYCATEYPKATVYIGQCGYCTSFNEANRNVRLRRLLTRVTPAYSNNTSSKFVYLDGGLPIALHDSDLMASDGVHPNQAGHNMISKCMYNAMHGCVSVHKTEYGSCTLDNDHPGSANVEFYTIVNNYNKRLLINNFSITLTSPITIYNSGFTEILINNSKILRPTDIVAFPCAMYIKDNSDNEYINTGVVCFENGKVGFKINSSDSGIANAKIIKILTQEGYQVDPQIL